MNPYREAFAPKFIGEKESSEVYSFCVICNIPASYSKSNFNHPLGNKIVIVCNSCVCNANEKYNCHYTNSNYGCQLKLQFIKDSSYCGLLELVRDISSFNNKSSSTPR